MLDLAFIQGDLVPNGQGGLVMSSGVDLDSQDIQYRILTNDPEQIAWSLGANLEDLVGMENNQDTGNLGVTKINRSLSFDGRFLATGISTTATPVSMSQIEFAVTFLSRLVTTTQPIYTTVVDLTGMALS